MERRSFVYISVIAASMRLLIMCFSFAEFTEQQKQIYTSRSYSKSGVLCVY